MVLDELQKICRDDGRWHDSNLRAGFGRARIAIASSRSLAYQVIDERVKGRPNGPIVNLARVAMVRAERAVAGLALDVLAADSLRLGSISNSQLKTSMIAGLGGGSVEVQLNLIAKALFEMRGA
jgi:hypothetical protein